VCAAALTESQLDGIHVINANFRTIVASLKKKAPETVLNIRSTAFDDHYATMKSEVQELLHRTQEIVNECFRQSCTAPIHRTLALLLQCEKIKSIGLSLDDKYDQAFLQFEAELCLVREVSQPFRLCDAACMRLIMGGACLELQDRTVNNSECCNCGDIALNLSATLGVHPRPREARVGTQLTAVSRPDHLVASAFRPH